MQILRKLYNWVLGLADTPFGIPALFLIAVAESSFFPIPPDVLLIALGMARPYASFYYAFICSLGSVLGGLAGYAIGWGLWLMVQGFFFRYVFSQETFNKVVKLYNDNAFWAVFTAGFTPIPYKVFTISAGVCGVPLLVFTLASILSRSARFFLVSLVIRNFGVKAKTLIDKYFEAFTLAFMVLLFGGFAIVRWLSCRNP